VQSRAGFRDYDRAIPVPEIFQVRCFETNEAIDVDACNRAMAVERASSDPERAVATFRDVVGATRTISYAARS
jgi:hypothetical protein